MSVRLFPEPKNKAMPLAISRSFPMENDFQPVRCVAAHAPAGADGCERKKQVIFCEKWSKAWIGLGGNVGDVRAHMAHALQRLAAAHDIELCAVSSLYRTPPWGKTDQPWFFNAAAALATTLAAPALLDFCLMLERECHRKRQERWGPRTLDIDLLFFVPNGDSDKPHENNANLTLPHPRIKERAFVLLPLAEIAPMLLLDGRTIADWAGKVKADGIEKISPPQDWWKRAD